MVDYVEYQKAKICNDRITCFLKDYFWLSNFYPCEVYSDGFAKPINFKSSESLFQALKCPTRADEFENLMPTEAKKLGRKVNLRNNWDSIKVDCMRYCLRSKFDQHNDLKDKLILTGNAHLEEANSWGDRFWGTVNGEGKNFLGKLLMELRDEYQQEYEKSMSCLN